MEIRCEFEELLGLLNESRASYLVVGSYALAHHGVPRYTGDIDLLLKPEPDNARRVLAALEAFGVGSLNWTADDLTAPDNVIQIGVPPARVDLLTSISGVSWELAWAGREPGTCGATPVFYIGRNEYIANKRALGRKKDLADLEALGEL